MRVLDSVGRWSAAVGLVAAPLLVFVVPPLLNADMAGVETLEEQFRMLVASGGEAYGSFLLQAMGFAALAPAAIGVFLVARAAGRGLLAALVGGALALLAVFAGLLAVGMELAQMFTLVNGHDKEEMIALGVALFGWWWFTVFLLGALIGFVVCLPILAISLWRAGAVHWLSPLLFGVPLAIPFLPLPEVATNLGTGVALLIACAVAAIGLVRPREVSDGRPAKIMVS